MKKTGILRSVLCVFLLAVMAFNIVSCAGKALPTGKLYTGGSQDGLQLNASDLMKEITAKVVNVRPADGKFTGAAADFAFRLFEITLTENENSLISPLSVLVALAMTANGASGETLSEMEAILGGGMSIETLNEYLKAYVDGLPSEEKYKLSLANSIWFLDDEKKLSVEKSFLQTNADYYRAAVYKAPFDNKLVEDVNAWVNENTDGLIDKILDGVDPSAVMYLINALVFDAEWDVKYSEDSIIKNYDFTDIKGEVKKVDMMVSKESRYITLKNATGFAKDYSGGKYSFVALLPDEGLGLYDFIKTLDGQSFTKALKKAKNTRVSAYLPAFENDYTVNMNSALASLGMPTAFNDAKADFSRLGESGAGNLFISNVVHKTYIAVDASGTRAGAVTSVAMATNSAPQPPEFVVKLDRPFVYAIVDNATNLPIFIGTVAGFK